LSHRRLLLAALLVACAAAAARAQQPPAQTCKLTVGQSPQLRGFRLGMTLEQAKAHAPRISVQEPNLGYVRAHFAPDNYRDADPNTFEGVRDVFLGFLDERLVSLSVRYDDRVLWRGVGEFASRVSESLKLPDVWRKDDQNGHYAMTCDGFVIAVRLNHITLDAEGVQPVLQERRERLEEERRRKFRP
jgi:hypothetical protein